MPKKIIPSQRLKEELANQLQNNLLDLSTLLIKTSTIMIQTMMEEERGVFLKRTWAERSKDAVGYANGYESRRVATAEGTMNVYIPQVRNSSEPFRSQVIELLKNRTENIELLALKLYVSGLSYADIAEICAHDLKIPNMSETVIMNMCKSLQKEYDLFNSKDLSGIELLYLFIDGIYLHTSRNQKMKDAVLVSRGYTTSGEAVLLGMSVGPRESYESWKGFLSDMVGRGLKSPLLVTSDGCAGMIKAVREVFPYAARQRCLFHLRGTLMNSVPDLLQPEIKDRLEEVFGAKDYAEAQKAAKDLIREYTGKAQSFVDKLQKNLEAALTYYKFPEAHWKHIRTSNSIERLFEEVKRRTKIIPSFNNESACLMVCHAVIVELTKKKHWNKLVIESKEVELIDSIRKYLFQFKRDITDFQVKKAA